MALSRLRQSPHFDSLTVHFILVDVIQERNLSREIADEYGIDHESPQVLLIRNGQCIYDRSHSSIRMTDIQSFLESNNT